jgi:hypothetical protein
MQGLILKCFNCQIEEKKLYLVTYSHGYANLSTLKNSLKEY